MWRKERKKRNASQAAGRLKQKRLNVKQVIKMMFQGGRNEQKSSESLRGRSQGDKEEEED